jgi:Ni,Fe-hydrogenase III small subunit
MGDVDRREHHITLWRVLLDNLISALRRRSQQENEAMRSEAVQWLARHPVSLPLRHLDCGSCGGCELELIALGNPVYDIEQYGIRFQAWPRHAVYLAMTGPLTRGLVEAARFTLDAMPEPAIIAIGDCALGIGPFEGAYGIAPRPQAIEEAIRLRIPGCPPSPAEILEALAGWIQRSSVLCPPT